jgi:predicted ATPase
MTLCSVLATAACHVALLVGDLATAELYVKMLLDHSARHGLTRWRAFCREYQGVLLIRRGDLLAGLPLLHDTVNKVGAARSAIRLMPFMAEAAEALGLAGQIADGLAALDDAIDHSERAEERWHIAELLRVKGELLLLEGRHGAAATAEDLFRQALDWARWQETLSWELRAATSLARLRRDQGRSTDATALLQPVYDRFTEGFDTTDLKEARLLLDALR